MIPFPSNPVLRISEIPTNVMDQAQQRAALSKTEPPPDAAVMPSETSDRAEACDKARPVDRERLVNKLNYLNFQDRTVLLAFAHARYGHELRVEARPQPCRDNRLRCTWVDPRVVPAISRYYVFSSLFVPDEQKLLQGIGRVTAMDEAGIDIELPEQWTEVRRPF